MIIQLKHKPPVEIEFFDTISAWGVTHDLSECESYPKIQQKHDTIQVAIIEDNEETRLNLRKNLRSPPGIEVASEATNAETGLVLLESIDVDVAVVDSTLPNMNLVKFIRMVTKVQAGSYVIPSKILVLAMPDQESILSEALSVGANGFCLKDSPI
ncbi:MAG TPA: hypothetical protein DEF27_02785 [Oscillatoriales bacterium UBA8482]|nr:MAG: hypothetical protein AUK43_12820 [Oscillatoriales cyanobacterium CG2_30_40_61]HBW56769.1 hypothetical protein [Oscillatoriales bacterium UBA8482]